MCRLAIGALTRAAERAERAGAPGRAATIFQNAADLEEQQDQTAAAGTFWERAGNAWVREADLRAAAKAAERAQVFYDQISDHWASARARALAGRALRREGRYREAREQLQAAVAVLRAEASTDTVNALQQLAVIETMEGDDDATELLSEVLNLAQGLDVDDSLLSDLLLVNGLRCLLTNGRWKRPRTSRRPLTWPHALGDTNRIGVALCNLSGVEITREPQSAAVHAAEAVDHLRRSGNRGMLATATANLGVALLLQGDWDGVAQHLDAQPELESTMTDIGFVSAVRGWLSALRGDVVEDVAANDYFLTFAASEDAQLQAILCTTRALLRRQREDRSKRSCMPKPRSVTEKRSGSAANISCSPGRWDAMRPGPWETPRRWRSSHACSITTP